MLSDLNAVLRHSGFQASSIHSRKHHPFHRDSHSPRNASPPPPPLLPTEQNSKSSSRMAREYRLLSDLWLMSAATFRRLGQIEQAKGAIQEAEVKDEDNPAVWVQVSLLPFPTDDSKVGSLAWPILRSFKTRQQCDRCFS